MEDKHSDPPVDYAVFEAGNDGWWYAVWIERWKGGTPWLVHELIGARTPPGQDRAYVRTFYTRAEAVAACWANEE